MFDFLRNLTRSTDDKQQEALNAYLDNALSAREQARVEQQLSRDPALQAELNQLRQVKGRLQQLPRLRAPRNFTLDPAVYGRPVSNATVRLYPFIRTATALTAFMFILVLGLTFFNLGGLPMTGGAQEQAMEAPAAARDESDAVMESEPLEPGEIVEVTRAVAEQMTNVMEEVIEGEVVEEAAESVEDSADGDTVAPAAPVQATLITPTLGIVSGDEATATPTAPPLATPAVVGALPQPTAEEPAADALRPDAPLNATETETDSEVPAVQPTDTAATEEETVATDTGFLSGWSALQIATAVLGLLLFVLLITMLTLRRRLY